MLFRSFANSQKGALGLGDEMAAEEWHGIAEAAEHLVKEDASG